MARSSHKCLGQDSRIGKVIESYLGLNRAKENTLVTFLQRLTKAVQIGVTDLEAIESSF